MSTWGGGGGGHDHGHGQQHGQQHGEAGEDPVLTVTKLTENELLVIFENS